MGNLIIDGKLYSFEEKDTVLKVAKENNIDIPTLCYLKDCGNIGQCGVCLVEVEGEERLARACAKRVKEGMVISTNSERVINERKIVIASMLNKHEFKCGPCGRKENCEFLKLVIKTKSRANNVFKVENKNLFLDARSKAIEFDRSKCTVCGRCVAACRSYTKTNSINFHKVDGERRVGANELKCFDDTNCLLCGQCVVACPVDALREKSHIDRVQNALNDDTKHTIVAIAPAVRTSMSELFNLGFGVDTTGKIYTALRELGFDKIFDIGFGADMTTMEETHELLNRLNSGENLPMFTSCCPSWIRQVEKLYPELKDNLSTTKSPQQIFGATVKTYYAKLMKIDPKDIFIATVMPCTSKKFEADRKDFEFEGNRNIDAVITTRELAKMIKVKKLKFASLEDSKVDSLMGEYSGSGMIFGSTGGVMESALRLAKDLVDNKVLEEIEYSKIRGLSGIKEATIKVGDKDINIAVINGASNLTDFIKKGEVAKYHFIEVMTCNGGCINGGGQPHLYADLREDIDSIKLKRASVLYSQDNTNKTKIANKNPYIKKLYDEFVLEPYGSKAHEVLHYHYK